MIKLAPKYNYMAMASQPTPRLAYPPSEIRPYDQGLLTMGCLSLGLIKPWPWGGRLTSREEVRCFQLIFPEVLQVVSYNALVVSNFSPKRMVTGDRMHLGINKLYSNYLFNRFFCIPTIHQCFISHFIRG